jgi:hypothetical protein
MVNAKPGRFTRGKETRYSLYRRLGGPQGRSERVQKISPPPEFDPRTVQPVASHYTDWAIPALTYSYNADTNMPGFKKFSSFIITYAPHYENVK